MAALPAIPPKPSKITIPERCHPLAKVIFREMQRQRVTYADMEWKSGVLISTFKAWRKQNRPGLETLEACLGVLGYSLLPVPNMAALPPKIAEGLKALAEEWGAEDDLLTHLMLNVCRPEIAAVRPTMIDVVPTRVITRPRRSTEPNPLQTSLFEGTAQ